MGKNLMAEATELAKELATARALLREALAKGPERRCPWCWVVAHRGKHSPDCRAMALLGE